jgi:hypothetical protein
MWPVHAFSAKQSRCLAVQVSTSDTQDINVATKIDAFVYNTIAQWYNEDARTDGSNDTLPAAPSGPQPAPADNGPKTFLGIRLEWNNPVFIAVRTFLPQLRPRLSVRSNIFEVLK